MAGPKQATITELDGKNLDGRALKVNEAQERQPRGSASPGGEAAAAVVAAAIAGRSSVGHRD